MKKRFVGLLLACLACTFGLWGCGGGEKSQTDGTQQTVQEQQSAEDAASAQQGTEGENGLMKAVIGYYGGTCEAPIFVAKEKGFFEEAGLDMETVLVTKDTQTLVATNKIDAIMVTPNIFKSLEQGLDIKIIDGCHTGCIQGVAAPDSGIQSPADLKGKKIGIGLMGDVPMILLSSKLTKAGLDPVKDVEWLVYPEAQLEMAMNKGEIDCFTCWDPLAELAVNNGGIRFYSNTFDEDLKDMMCCFVAVNGASYEANPEMARRVAKAFSLANAFITENPEETAEIIINNKYTAGDVEVTAKLLGDYQWVSNDETRAKESMIAIFNMLDENGVLEENTDIQAIVDKTFQYMGE